ncbi:MAG: oligosaccharide flippase family protein [Gaiellaceae bacterium]
MPGDTEPTEVRPSFVSSAVITYATQLVVGVLSLANVFIVARNLGAQGRGDVAFLAAIAYLTSQLASFGVQQANGNVGAAHPEKRPALATNSCLFAALYGSVAAAVVLTGIKLFPDVGGDQPMWLLLLALGVMPLMILSQYLLLLLQAEYRFVVSNASWLIPPILNVTLNGLLSVANALTPARAFSTWVLGQVISGAVLVYGVQRRTGFGRPDVGLAVESAKFGVKTHFGRIMLLGNYRVDQWILGAVSETRALGVYSVAVSWAEVLFFIPTVLSMVLRPDLARADRRGAGESASIVFRAAIVLTIPLAIFLIIAAPFLCVTLLGSDFAGSVPQMRILTLGAFGVVALKILGSSLTAQRRPYLETAAIGGAFVMTLLLDVLLIPGHAGMGASIASTVAYATGGVAVMLIFGRALGVPLRRLVPGRSDVRRLIAVIGRGRR